MDEQLARRDRELVDLLDQFVCVRLIQANGLDLSLLRFDFDLTRSLVFLNADRTVYGRYGSRADKDASRLVTIEGLRKSMAAALALHKGYPGNRRALADKSPTVPKVATPEQM